MGPSKSQFHICIVCLSSDFKLSMFKFPKDEGKLKWCNILDIGVDTIRARSLVCEKHFANSQFLDKQKRRLRKDALPRKIKSVLSTHELEPHTSTSTKFGQLQPILPIPTHCIIGTTQMQVPLLPLPKKPRPLAPRALAMSTTQSHPKDVGGQQLTFSPLLAFIPHTNQQPLQPSILPSSSSSFLSNQSNVVAQQLSSQSVLPLAPPLSIPSFQSLGSGVSSKLNLGPSPAEEDKLPKILGSSSLPITTLNLTECVSKVPENMGMGWYTVTGTSIQQISPAPVQTMTPVQNMTPVKNMTPVQNMTNAVHTALPPATSRSTTTSAHGVINDTELNSNNGGSCPAKLNNPNLLVMPSSSSVIIDKNTGNIYDGEGKPIYISTHKIPPEEEERIRKLTANLDETRRVLKKTQSQLSYTQNKLRRVEGLMTCPLPVSAFEERMKEAFSESKLLRELVVSQYRRHSSERERRRQYSNIEMEIASVLYEATGSAAYQTFHRMGMILPTGSTIQRVKRSLGHHTSNDLEDDHLSPSSPESDDETYEPPSKQRRTGVTVTSRGEQSMVDHGSSLMGLRQAKPKVQNGSPRKRLPRVVQRQYSVTGTGSERVYSCSKQDCTFTCGVFMTYLKHVKQHPPTLLRCPAPNCSYSTTKRPLLKSHSYVHVEEFSFSCDKCKKGFKSRCAYTVHMKTHRDDESLSKLFECGPRKCKFLTMSAETLKEHRSKCPHLQRTEVRIDPVVEVVIPPPEPSDLQTTEAIDDANTADPLQLNDEAALPDEQPLTLKCVSLS